MLAQLHDGPCDGAPRIGIENVRHREQVQLPVLARDQLADAIAADNLPGTVGRACGEYFAIGSRRDLGHEKRHQLQLIGEVRHRLEFLSPHDSRCVGSAEFEQFGEVASLVRHAAVPPTHLHTLNCSAALSVEERRERQIKGAFVLARPRSVGAGFDHAALGGCTTLDGRKHEPALRFIRVVKRFRAVGAAEWHELPALQKPQVSPARAREPHDGVQVAPVIFLGRDLLVAQTLESLKQFARGVLMPA